MREETNDMNGIIIRYLDGSAEVEEKVRLLHWLKQSDENRNDFTVTRDLWLSCEATAGNELEIDIALSKLKGRILQEQERMIRKDRRKDKLRSIAYRCLRIAAIFLCVLGLGYGLGVWQGRSTADQRVQRQLITAQGSKGQFVLPDGTVVWLNSDSRLSYPEPFSDQKRLVVLDGEAYFEVAKDAGRPFVVQTGEVDIEVLGTSFNVNNYASFEYVQMALLNGRVRISGASIPEPIDLLPDELFKYRKSDQVFSVEKSKAGRYADWMKDRLVFDNDCLSDILVSMAGRYAMVFECPESFAVSTRLSFTIRQESIRDVMEAICLIVPIRYEIGNGKVIIIPK